MQSIMVKISLQLVLYYNGPTTVNLALLAVQAGLSPGCYILGKTVPDICRRNKPPGGKPPRMGKVTKVIKCLLEFFRYHWSKNALDTSPTRL